MYPIMPCTANASPADPALCSKNAVPTYTHTESRSKFAHTHTEIEPEPESRSGFTHIHTHTSTGPTSDERLVSSAMRDTRGADKPEPAARGGGTGAGTRADTAGVSLTAATTSKGGVRWGEVP